MEKFDATAPAESKSEVSLFTELVALWLKFGSWNFLNFEVLNYRFLQAVLHCSNMTIFYQILFSDACFPIFTIHDRS